MGTTICVLIFRSCSTEIGRINDSRRVRWAVNTPKRVYSLRCVLNLRLGFDGITVKKWVVKWNEEKNRKGEKKGKEREGSRRGIIWSPIMARGSKHIPHAAAPINQCASEAHQFLYLVPRLKVVATWVSISDSLVINWTLSTGAASGRQECTTAPVLSHRNTFPALYRWLHVFCRKYRCLTVDISATRTSRAPWTRRTFVVCFLTAVTSFNAFTCASTSSYERHRDRHIHLLGTLRRSSENCTAQFLTFQTLPCNPTNLILQ